MSSVEKTIQERYAKFVQDEERFLKKKLEIFQKKIQAVLTFLYLAVVCGGLAYLTLLLGVSIKNEGGRAAYFIFIGSGMIGAICGLIWGWFKETRYRYSWLQNMTKYCLGWYGSHLEYKDLKDKDKERKEFFRFYTLYSTDEAFKQSYNAQMSSTAEEEAFLKKIETNRHTSS